LAWASATRQGGISRPGIFGERVQTGLMGNKTDREDG
jgi:hypothetical protein